MVMDDVTKDILARCMMFSDDIVLVEKNLEEINKRLDEWRLALEGKRLRISRNKIEYIEYDF
jgi:hypothetical protein